MSANTVLDNKLMVDHPLPVDPVLIRKNITANRQEARKNYQQQANKSTRANSYKAGDLVILKRTHGSHPKMNPIWVGPYQIIKQIGPVNWAIRDQTSGKTKIVHHNLLKPALSKQDATITPALDFSNAITQTSKVLIGNNIPTGTNQRIESIPQHQLDREQFTRNVINTPNTDIHVSQSNPPQPAAAQVSRVGRIVKPVIGTRLIDQIG